MSVIPDPDEPDRHAIDATSGALMSPIWFGPVGASIEELTSREPVGWVADGHFQPAEDQDPGGG